MTRPGSNNGGITGRPRCSRNRCDPARGNAAGTEFAVRDGAILLNAIKLILPVQSPMQIYFACLVGQINSTSFSRLAPSRRGVSRSSRTLGAGCGGRGSVARANGVAGRVHMDFRERCAGAQTNEAEADGKTVWS